MQQHRVRSRRGNGGATTVSLRATPCGCPRVNPPESRACPCRPRTALGLPGASGTPVSGCSGCPETAAPTGRPPGAAGCSGSPGSAGACQTSERVSAGVVQSRWRQVSRISARTASGCGRGPTAAALRMNTSGRPSKRASWSSSGAAAAGCWLVVSDSRDSAQGSECSPDAMCGSAGRRPSPAGQLGRLGYAGSCGRRGGRSGGSSSLLLLLRRTHHGEPIKDNAMNVPDPSGWPSFICRLTGGWGLHAGAGGTPRWGRAAPRCSGICRPQLHAEGAELHAVAGSAGAAPH